MSRMTKKVIVISRRFFSSNDEVIITLEGHEKEVNEMIRLLSKYYYKIRVVE